MRRKREKTKQSKGKRKEIAYPLYGVNIKRGSRKMGSVDSNNVRCGRLKKIQQGRGQDRDVYMMPLEGIEQRADGLAGYAEQGPLR